MKDLRWREVLLALALEPRKTLQLAAIAVSVTIAAGPEAPQRWRRFFDGRPFWGAL